MCADQVSEKSDSTRRASSQDEEELYDALNSFRKNVKQIWPGSGVNAETIDDLEAALLQSDVTLDTTQKLIEPLKENPDIENGSEFLRNKILEIFENAGSMDIHVASEGPTVFYFIGVNGSGKTTTIAKLAHKLEQQGEFMFAAADTYRAAAIEQLQKWADKLNVEMISHEQGGDPSAVVYDAVEASRSRDTDFLMVDTAGRLHTRGDLLDQLEKMYGVTDEILGREPNESFLVLDASTGQNGLKQVEKFAEHLPISGIVLTKLDSTARGGITLSVADELGVPVKLVGTGENLDDLVPFVPKVFCDAILNPVE